MNGMLISAYPRAQNYLRVGCPYILLGAAVLVVSVTETQYLPIAIGILAAGSVGMVVWAKSWSDQAATKFEGEMVDFVFAPTPMGSLLSALNKQGVGTGEIATIKLMSSDLVATKKYLSSPRNGDEPFITVVDRCKDMHVLYYGSSDDPNIESGHPRIKFIPTKQKLIEHVNLVQTKSKGEYLWYEPYHQLIDGEDCFAGGAYLIELTPRGIQQVEHRFQDAAPAESQRSNYAYA